MPASRAERILGRVVLGAAVLVTLLGVALLGAALRNDGSISGQLGTATATVQSVSFDRTIISFETPDGVLHVPPTGVLYPEGLAAGDLVQIEYDAGNPDLARVAGRGASLTLLPLGSMIGFTWLVAGPLLWWLRRPRTTATGSPVMTPTTASPPAGPEPAERTGVAPTPDPTGPADPDGRAGRDH